MNTRKPSKLSLLGANDNSDLESLNGNRSSQVQFGSSAVQYKRFKDGYRGYLTLNKSHLRNSPKEELKVVFVVLGLIQ